MSTDLVQHNISDLTQMAEAVAQSGLFGMKSWQQALALMLVAQAEGQHPATITQDYDIIQGKACRKTHSVMARFQQMGGRVEWHQLDESVADATFSHQAAGSLRMKWTIDQAKRAGLTGKDNWKSYPRAMLRARVIAEGIRAVYPAAIGGMLIAEEAQDAPPTQERDITAESEVISKELAKPAIPPYPQANFDKILKKWRESGTMNADDFISTLQTRGILSPEQIAEVRKPKMPPPQNESEMSDEEIAMAHQRDLEEAQA